MENRYCENNVAKYVTGKAKNIFERRLTYFEGLFQDIRRYILNEDKNSTLVIENLANRRERDEIEMLDEKVK